MKALLCGYYGMGNGGDEALLASLLQMLPEQVTPLVLSGNPRETRDRYGVRAIPRKSPAAVLWALKEADAFIWGGGSLMQDASSALNPLYYGGLMRLAQLMGLKTIAWAQGIGPLNRPLSRWLTRTALARCTQVSVRDASSQALLQRWHQDCLLAPDPVWALAEASPTDLPPLPKPWVAVALRPHPHLSETRLATFAQALDLFQTATGVSLLLVPFQLSRDLAIAQTLSEHLSRSVQEAAYPDAGAQSVSFGHAIYHNPRPTQLKGLFRQVEMTIGMRFHALVMSAAAGCCTFAVSYDPKVDALARDLPLPGWDLSPLPAVLPPLPEDAQILADSWISTYQQQQKLSNEQIQARVEETLRHRQLLAKALLS